MKTTLCAGALVLAACSACGSTPAMEPAAPPHAVAAPPPIAVAEVDVARRAYGCANDASSPACSAIARFASGHAPALPTQARAYIGVTTCPVGAIPPDVGMYSVMILTSRDGSLAMSNAPEMTTSDVLSALALASDTPVSDPADPVARRIVEAARTSPAVVDTLASLRTDASLDAAVVGSWMVREAEGGIYEIDRDVGEAEICVTVYHPVATVEVRVADEGPAVQIDYGVVSDEAPPPVVDPEVRAFVASHLAAIEAVADRAVAPCATHQVGASPARGTPVATWPETAGVSASCMAATPEGAAIGSNFLHQGDPEGPMGTWARYGRDGTLASHCSFSTHDCTDFSVNMSDARYVRVDARRPVPNEASWVEVHVLLHR